MLENYIISNLEITGFFRNGNGCFLKNSLKKNKEYVYFGTELNHLQKRRSTKICFSFSGDWNGKQVIDVDSILPDEFSFYGTHEYFFEYISDKFSSEDIFKMEEFKFKNSKSKKSLVEWLIYYPEFIDKMSFLSSEQIDSMRDYFGKYHALDFIAQKFPPLKGKKFEERTLIEALYEQFGVSVVNLIEENPYRFVNYGYFKAYNFKLAEEIAYYIGLKKDSSLRISAIFDETFKKAFKKFGGDTAFQLDQQRVNWLLNCAIYVSGYYFSDRILSYNLFYYNFFNNDFEIYEIISVSNYNYLVNKELNKNEVFTANYIKNALLNEPLIKATKRKIDNRIKKFEQMESIKFTKEQIEAIHNSINNRFSIITGGPGCGKTKVVQAILYIVQDMTDCEKVVTSYTGKALKRMDEVLRDCKFPINYHKSTILSYYYQPDCDEFHPYPKYIKKDSCINNMFIVIDEASMVSQMAFGQFLSILNNCQLVVIGDCNQLPSIDRGQVLYDLINFDKTCVSRLTKNLRLQTLSNNLRDKMLLNYDLILNNNYFGLQYISNHFFWKFVCENNKTDVVYRLVDDYISYINGTNGKEKVNIEDICILTPTKKQNALLSSTNLNLYIQHEINPYGKNTFCKYGKGYIRIDDRVILTKNMKNDGAYNGDIGTVTDFDNRYITVEFDDGNVVEFNRDDSNDCLELAYAMTVHKSQGSEYKIVLFALDYSINFWQASNDLINKNLIYTAITRTKGIVLFYGSQNVLKYGIEHNSKSRFTLLPQYLASDLV